MDVMVGPTEALAINLDAEPAGPALLICIGAGVYKAGVHATRALLFLW